MSERDMLYQRQRELNIPKKRVAIIGSGGNGTWIAILLAMSGSEVYVFDNDTLEIHNLNRLPFTLNDLNKPKVEVLKDFLKQRLRKCYAFNTRVRNVEEVLVLNPEHVVIAIDNYFTARKFALRLRELKIPFTVVFYDGDLIDIYHNVVPPENVFDANPQQSGYTTVPSWVLPPVFIASIVTELVLRQPLRENEIHGTIPELVENLFEKKEKREVFVAQSNDYEEEDEEEYEEYEEDEWEEEWEDEEEW